MSKILKSSLPYEAPVTENLIEFIRNGLRNHAEETIIIDSVSDRRWTGASLERQITKVAAYLRDECHLKNGEICTLYARVDDHIIILLLAVIAAGGVVNPATDAYRVRDVIDTARQLKSSFFFGTKALLTTLKGQLEPGSGARVLSIDEACEGFETCYGPIKHLFEPASDDEALKLNSKSPFDELASRVVPSQLAFVQFSSGTTGKPKPIPRTHKSLCHMVASVDHEELMRLRRGEVLAGSLSITHRPGLWGLLACIHGESTYVIWGYTTNIKDGLSVIEKYRVTTLSSSVPFLAELAGRGVPVKNDYDLSSLKHVITSGSKIVSEELPRLVVKEFGLESLRQCFGMTEAGWLFLLERSLAKHGNYLTVGRVVPGSEAAIVDRDNLQLVNDAGTRGELVIRGPQVFEGYMDCGEGGVYSRRDFIEEGGWFRTGDRAYFDESECIFIEGRYKELMLLNFGLYTTRIFPSEIELMFNEHPGVEDSCVINMNQNQPSDVARVFVTLKADHQQVTAEELLEFVCRQTHKVVVEGGIFIIDKLPRLMNGKVDKSSLKAMRVEPR